MNGAITWKEAQSKALACQKAGGIVVTTNGSFDILHQGHVSYLSAARGMGDLLLVGLNSDASVKRYKGESRPLNGQEARAYVLSALKCVDGVCIFEDDTPVEWLEMIRPQIHVKGGDWDVEKIPEAKVVATWGGKVHAIPFVDGFSTSSIIRSAQGKK